MSPLVEGPDKAGARLAICCLERTAHQQYLFKVPNGYCGIGGTNVKLGDPSGWAACPTGLVPTEDRGSRTCPVQGRSAAG
ncbi:hypothetical protein GCM10027612_14850 [Microbispora bryophytorum subsp. camponoti]